LTTTAFAFCGLVFGVSHLYRLEKKLGSVSFSIPLPSKQGRRLSYHTPFIFEPPLTQKSHHTPTHQNRDLFSFNKKKEEKQNGVANGPRDDCDYWRLFLGRRHVCGRGRLGKLDLQEGTGVCVFSRRDRE
jgi:hypothetical protein